MEFVGDRLECLRLPRSAGSNRYDMTVGQAFWSPVHILTQQNSVIHKVILNLDFFIRF